MEWFGFQLRKFFLSFQYLTLLEFLSHKVFNRDNVVLVPSKPKQAFYNKSKKLVPAKCKKNRRFPKILKHPQKNKDSVTRLM